MSSLSLRLPNSLHKQLRELAQRDGVSINQFITIAVAEKVSALTTVDYLDERAKNGTRKKFQAVLDKIPDVEPSDFDRVKSRPTS